MSCGEVIIEFPLINWATTIERPVERRVGPGKVSTGIIEDSAKALIILVLSRRPRCVQVRRLSRCVCAQICVHIHIRCIHAYGIWYKYRRGGGTHTRYLWLWNGIWWWSNGPDKRNTEQMWTWWKAVSDAVEPRALAPALATTTSAIRRRIQYAASGKRHAASWKRKAASAQQR